ncbi:hypothetical protein ACEN19_10065 [Corynebacterium auriscanis]|uniref:hypothetical protein n=1 Tax=Corynebacterium auriscanis TaxID=99807 RepID=UPI003CFACDE4
MALERFHFTTADGKELDLPFLKDAVTRKAFKKVFNDSNNADDLDDDELFKAAKFDKATVDIIDNMSVRDYEKFIMQWTEQGDTPLGES